MSISDDEIEQREDYAVRRWHAYLTEIGVPPVFEAMKPDYTPEQHAAANEAAKKLPYTEFAARWEAENPFVYIPRGTC